jgi:putative nucleotidyltransferase with HDIG domain
MSNIVETIPIPRTHGATARSVPAVPQSGTPNQAQIHAPPDGAISLSEIVSALSFALDLTEDARPGHAVRTCLLGMRIAGELGLSDDQLSNLYYALLLKDVGCSCNANLLCEAVGGDDRTIKRMVKLEDWRYPSLSGFKLLWEHTSPGGAFFYKSRRVLALALRRRRFRSELVRLRCECGAKVARKIGLGADSIAAISNLDEHWNGGGYPAGLRGDAVPILARVINIAQCLDLFASENGTHRAMRLVRNRRRTWFDPELVRVAESLAAENRLWQHYGSGMERKAVLDLEPGSTVRAGERRVDDIVEAFADVVDAKSPFTYSHSLGVKDAAMAMARQMGLSEERSRLVRRAALLHDLGKLRVPNTILDKPGQLDVIEWQIVREHPGLSSEIVGRVKHFKDVARVVGEHHERLDGSGYPGGLRADQLSLESRIVAVADVYTALLEDRSYRSGMSADQAMATLSERVPEKLDADCCSALFASITGAPFEPARTTLLPRDMYA